MLGLMGFSGSLPCTLFIDIISLCLLIGQIKMLACLRHNVRYARLADNQ